MASVPVNYADQSKSELMHIWHERVIENGGVHPWTNKHDGMRVFQEWISLLLLHEHENLNKKIELGKAFERYIVTNNLQALSKVGTSLPLPGYKPADFDMTLLGCISLLGLFEKDTLLLTNKTYVHLIKIISRCWGQESKHYFEVLLFNFQETENHIFMIESARYLTNQFIWQNVRDLSEIFTLKDSLIQRNVVLKNDDGVLYQLLLKKMQQIVKSGFFEFNAKVYQRFTLHALNNLYSFSKDSLIKVAAACVLDYSSIKFAFQSAYSIRLGPYRRSAEKFWQDTLFKSDPAISFYAAQSASFPGYGNLCNDETSRSATSLPSELICLWRQSLAHSSIALFSSVLSYRVPVSILYFMQTKKHTYSAVMETKRTYKGMRESSPEIYFSTPKYLVSAGGKYKFYRGPNFPVKYTNFFMSEVPWVYDILSRSSSILLYPFYDRNRSVPTQVLKFKGNQWKENNLAVYKNFIFGYAKNLSDSTKGHNIWHNWPQNVPEFLNGLPFSSFSTPLFDYRLFSIEGIGISIVMSRLKHKKTFFKHRYQSYLRGGIEVINQHETVKTDAIINQKKLADSASLNQLVYTLWSGDKIFLNRKYNRHRNGFSLIEQPVNKALDNESVQGVPFSVQKFPLLKVRLMDNKNHTPGAIIVQADGKGNLQMSNPFTGDSLTILFEAWWFPRRINAN
ncbi:MAG: hypothetical protein HQK83_12385 [Fibrobacteria bacterium]|nr:hypothetical protein [Fibrobacteria bacterium]